MCIPGSKFQKIDQKATQSPMVFLRLLDINFLFGGYKQAKSLLEGGALMVVPAAPALVNINSDNEYYDALKRADFAIPDSGLMVLILKLLKDFRFKKLSGLAFLKQFLAEKELISSQCIFLVDPNEEERKANHQHLRSRGVKIGWVDHYIAPVYGSNVQDNSLLEILKSRKPKYILINLGGGVQERLAVFLRDSLNYRPGIICTGAAISFLTRRQVNIPPIVDKFYMGWFLRCVKYPTRFIPRYLQGIHLIPLLIKELKRP